MLQKSQPSGAAKTLREMIATKVEVCHASDIGIDTDVCLDPDVCNIAFSNLIRSFHWLLQPITRQSHSTAKQRLGLLHFLPPVLSALHTEAHSADSSIPIVFCHMTDNKAQLDASKSSIVYSGVRLEEGRDVHLAVCNLRAFFLTALPRPEACLVFQKLFQYLKVLSSPDGRNWLTAHRHNLAIPVHLYQECQHILGMFLSVASRPTLRATL